MSLTPYLFFDGRCEEAIEFYKKVLDAKVEMMLRFKESPEPSGMEMAPGTENKIMHATVRINGASFMASDGYAGGNPKFQGFSLAVTAKDEGEAERVFAALADGGKVEAPLAKTFFAKRFGMVADRFGVSWMVTVDA